MAEDAKEEVATEDRLPLRASESIEGNILASFNKPHQRFLFISFMNNREGARRWLGKLVDEVATTSQVVAHGTIANRRKTEASNFFLRRVDRGELHLFWLGGLEF